MASFVLVHCGFLSIAEVHKVLLPSIDLKLNTETGSNIRPLAAGGVIFYDLVMT